jgi:nucleoside-diphosphate-sugar epimerase
LPELTTKRVAVTGATGLLGGYLIRALLRRGADPIAVVRNPQRAEALHALGVEVRTADLADVTSLTQAFAGADSVIGNAALVSFKPHPFNRYLDVNVEGTIHVFHAMKAAGVSRAIHISSVGIYRGHRAPVDEDHPRYGEAHRHHRFNGYKVSKALAEETAWRYASKYEIDLTSLRPSVLYGAFDRNFCVWHKRALRMWPLALYPRFARFGLAYAGDVAEAAMLALENRASSGKAYNVAGNDRSLWQFSETWMSEDPSCTSRRIPLPMRYRRTYDCGRIQRDLGWKPRSHVEGIRETLELEGALARTPDRD